MFIFISRIAAEWLRYKIVTVIRKVNICFICSSTKLTVNTLTVRINVFMMYAFFILMTVMPCGILTLLPAELHLQWSRRVRHLPHALPSSEDLLPYTSLFGYKSLTRTSPRYFRSMMTSPGGGVCLPSARNATVNDVARRVLKQSTTHVGKRQILPTPHTHAGRKNITFATCTEFLDC